MKCDHCGCQFPAHEAVEITASEQIGSPRSTGPTETKLVRRTLCPDCADSRRRTMRLFVWIIVVLLGLGLLWLAFV